MPTNEEGEFELVLGNKQLLSVFFLVVLLLGVFFSMGYIVGRNTAPAPAVSAANRQPPILVDSAGPGSGRSPVTATTPSSPSVLTPMTPDSSPKPSPSEVKPAAAAAVKAEPPAPKPEPVKATKPEPPPPPSPKPEPVKAASAAKPEPPKAVKPEPAKPAPAAATVAAATKGATYLQVVATKRGEAEQVVAKLAGKGFSAIISPVPDSQLVRVLVGPVAEPNVAKTRDGLNAAGFKPMVRKF